jgi:opacity protein-like surface antigen
MAHGIRRPGNPLLNDEKGSATMKKFLIAAVAAGALAVAATASAALEPGVFDPNNTSCVTATYSHGVLHLTKNCTAAQDAGAGNAAGAGITGLAGQTFQTGSFTLASASQCLGGSPRFNVYTTGGVFFLGCNNDLTPTTNADGTVTYTFTATDLQPQKPGTTPGTITSDGMSILIDQNGTADITNIIVNGQREVPLTQQALRKAACKNGAWKKLTNPTFKNQGQCIAHWNHVLHAASTTLHKHHK